MAVALSLVLALCVLMLPAATDDAGALETQRFVRGQVIVKLAPGVDIRDVDLAGLRVQERFLDRADANFYLLEITNDSSVKDVLSLLSKNRLIAFAEPNYLLGAPEADDGIGANPRHHAFPAGEATPTPNNYSKDGSYSEAVLNLSAARKVSKGDGSRVAVLDTGAQLDHPELKARFSGVPRFDFVGDDFKPSEPHLADTKWQRQQEVVGHGTHVAGIVHLVVPRAELMPLRVLNRDGYGNTFHVAEAITFADTRDADVINLSLGMPSWSRLLREKVVRATDHGAVVVAAAGNYNATLRKQYPAARSRLLPTAKNDDGLLAVTSVGADAKKSEFANYGKWVDIAAPGEEILSTYPRSGHAYWSGTSMATPFVAGEAALINAVYSLDPARIEKRIRSSARCVADDPLRLKLGAGHADIGNSLKKQPVEDRACTVLAN